MPTLVQQVEQDNVSAHTTDSVTIAATAAGNLLQVIVWQAAASTSVNYTITDNKGSTWTFPAAAWPAAVGPPPVDGQSAANTDVSTGYLLNIPAGITTVTINWAAASKTNSLLVMEWSGLATVGAVNVSVNGGGSVAATTQTAAALTTTNANDLVVFAVMAPTTVTFGSAGSTPTTGWTALTGGTMGSNHGGAVYQAFTSTGSRAASWTLGASAKAGMIGIAFKAASGSSFTQTATDSITVSESLARALALPRAVSEAITLAESLARGIALPRSPTDALSITDVATRAMGRTVTATDALTVTDAATRAALSLARTATDSLTLAEAPTSPVGRPRGATDALSVTDAATRSALANPRAVTDTVTVADNATSTGGSTPASTLINLPLTGAGT